MPQVANNQLIYTLQNGAQYIDVFKDLSAMNRKLIPQGRVAFITGFEYTVHSGTTGNGGNLYIDALPNNWVTHNAYVKAKAHWDMQQKRARSLIGASAKPKWEDFKVYFDESHRAGTTLVVPGLNYGEWDYSKLVWEADDNSIDEVYLHVMGNNVSTTDWGLILGYQQSRATVQAEDPELPDQYSTNMYAKLASDENLVADEVADNMEAENDEPPYDQDLYPGVDTNVTVGQSLTMLATPVTSSIDRSTSGVLAPCGLLRLTHTGISASDGSAATAPTAFLRFRVAFGNFKGLAAPAMGQ